MARQNEPDKKQQTKPDMNQSNATERAKRRQKLRHGDLPLFTLENDAFRKPRQ